MSDVLQEASRAFSALLAAADRCGLIPAEHRQSVLAELAFYGVSYGTIFTRLADACIEALTSLPEPASELLEREADEAKANIRVLLRLLSEETQYLPMVRASQLGTMLEEGQWQHVFRAVANKLVDVAVNEDADGSV